MGCGYFRGSGFGRHFRAQLKQRQPPIRAERFSLSWQVDTRNWFVCYNIAAVYEWALNSAVECHPHTVEVVGSNPTAPTTRLGSSPETWVTECTGYMGNTFGPKGFSSGSNTRVSRSKYPKS